MANLFWLQLRALIWKNWIVLSRHSFVTFLRCFVAPIAFGIFLATAQQFLNRLSNFGIGEPIAIYALSSQFNGQTNLIWADGTDGTSNPSPASIISRMTADFTKNQLAAVKQISSPAAIPAECPQNFNLFSVCFAAIAFYDIPSTSANSTKPINYTIYADSGLSHIDVVHHSSDFEKRILPLQWAIDKAIIELQTGVQQQTPLELPFNTETNEVQKTNIRISYLRGIRDLLGLLFLIAYIGIAYQLPGAFSNERALLITEHMKAMGLLNSARILSWHIGLSLTYVPAWVIVGIIWRGRIFTASNGGFIVLLHVLLGLVLASWSFFIAAPFGKSPQLAAVVTTFLSILFAILALVLKLRGTGVEFILSIIFPPMFYVFILKAVCAYEIQHLATDLLKGDPERGIVILPILLAGVIDVFLWPYIAVCWERYLYDAKPLPSERKSSIWAFWKKAPIPQLAAIPENDAIVIRDLTKIYKTSRFSKKGDVIAVTNLNLEIPKTGIFVLLGSNGAGKSTVLSIVGGLSSITGGTVTFEGGVSRPPRGTLGIVPQKNVLFSELTCIQTLRVWQAVKWTQHSEATEDLVQLLKDCDLEKKINANAATLSGGQKRKLQLAIGLLGGSKIVLVDECTSGVDPLSRRSLWKTLTSYREDRSIVFTTHFLDEADLLADYIAILAAPGKLVASGPPVTLKRDLGEGYSLQISFNVPKDLEKTDSFQEELLQKILTVATNAHVSTISPSYTTYHLKSRDTEIVRQVLAIVESEIKSSTIRSYDIVGTTIEDIFLDLMSKNEDAERDNEKSSESLPSNPGTMQLATGRPVSPYKQAFTIFHKRVLIAKRSWLTPLLPILIACAGACIPLLFLLHHTQSCTKKFQAVIEIPLFLPNSTFFHFQPGNSSNVLESPPGILSTLGASNIQGFLTTDVVNNATFVTDITQNFLNISFGGVSFNTDTGESLVAWEATPPGYTGPAMLNLASNVLLNRALNISGNVARIPTLLQANIATFPPLALGTLISLRWLGYFGAVMSVYPAFFALYVSKERRSSVQAMQLSNGLSDPVGLWLGHLMFDSITVVILSTIITAVFATFPHNFYGLGFLWFTFILYGITGALFAYCVSLMVPSPLAAFAAVAGYQFVVYALYTSSYLLVLTYGPVTQANSLINIIHFSTSFVAPVCSMIRAAFVSVNLFSLLCDGTTVVTTTSLGTIKRFGGPILYLFVYAFALLSLLVWVDSGSRAPRRLRPKKEISSGPNTASSSKDDVTAAAEAVAVSDDLLRVVNVSKSFDGNLVVDDVSLGVSKDTLFALLGPNGAGKTTMFNVIRGDLLPEIGEVTINGTSVIRHPRTARSHLGVCPQFTAIDSQLTVREHLIIYGRLKGLQRGPELNESVEAVMRGTSLDIYADRLASKLSGGNQRKLSLAISLIGNPSVILIDEFSTGIDPKMKRDMWQTLRKVAVGKAVVITTHSMEEASALASSVGILAKKMLAVGTTAFLSARYAKYEVHFTCRNREEIVKARTLMSLIPGARMADDVATRFEVPVDSAEGFSLADLFSTLSSHGDFTEYTVERASLESVFLKVIRANNFKEEDSERPRKRHWLLWWKL